MKPFTPPGPADRIIRLLVPPSHSADLLDGLHHDFRRRLEQGWSRGRARRWYWLQLLDPALWHLAILLRIGRPRVKRRVDPPQRFPEPTRTPWLLNSMGRDLRYAARSNWRRPGDSVLAAATLGLGLGLSTVVFSFVFSWMFRELPLPDGHRIMHLEETRPDRRLNQFSVSIPDLLDWKRSQTTFEALGAYRLGTVNMSVANRPYRVLGSYVTAEVLGLLGVRPHLGRTFLEEDDVPGALPTVVLGYSRWMSLFGGDPSVVGRTTRVNGEDATIIGVMPEGFAFPFTQDLWVPARADPSSPGFGQRGIWNVVGRLREGVTLEQARLEFDGIARSLADVHPETDGGQGIRIVPFTQTMIAGGLDAVGYSMLGVAVLVLLIACMNVASILLARAGGRVQDLRIRTALGASRARILMHPAAEAGLLAVLGGLVGVALAYGGLRLMERAFRWTAMPFWFKFSVDGPVLLFVLAATSVVAVLSGLIPGFRMGRMVKGGTALVGRERTTTRLKSGSLGRWLVVAQLAASVGILVPAGMMARGIFHLRSLDYGFNSENILTARFGFFNADFADAESRRSFAATMVERLRARPEFSAAAAGTALPGRRSGTAEIEVEDAAPNPVQEYPEASVVAISPTYFDIVEASVRQGRPFQESDGYGAPLVAIVNESFVDRFLPGETPIGKRFRTPDSSEEAPWLTIVGVVSDLQVGGADNPGQPAEAYYQPLSQSDFPSLAIMAKASADPHGLISVLRDEVASLDPESPLYNVQTLEETLRADVNLQYTLGGLFGFFALVSLLLAAMGLYGSVQINTSRRTREIGVRVALGADSSRVVGMILWGSVSHVFVGVLVGLGLGEILSRALGSVILFEQAWDVAIHFGTSLVLAGVVLIASLAPALRATRISPTEALRWE